jgi:hypothetical protein
MAVRARQQLKTLCQVAAPGRVANRGGNQFGAARRRAPKYLRVRAGRKNVPAARREWKERLQDALIGGRKRAAIHSCSAPGAPTLPLLGGGKQSRLLGTLD